MISQLYEDWLQSGQCWARSAIVMNASRSHEQRRRGVHVMKDRTWLLERYKDEVAVNSIIAKKREAQAQRKPGDPMFVMRNPDLPESEDPVLSSSIYFKNFTH